MGSVVHNVRELVSLARTLRQYGREASLPGYREKLLRAAAEVEAQLALQIGVPPQDWPSEEEMQNLHRPVDIKV